jgi:hypothetical protein
MIILFISTIWLATLVVVVAACRMAAHGDRVPLRRAERSFHLDGARSPRLMDIPGQWEREFSLRLEDRRAKPSRAPSEAATAEHVGNGSQEDLYVRP